MGNLKDVIQLATRKPMHPAISALYEVIREYARNVDERIVQGELHRLRDVTDPLLGPSDNGEDERNAISVRDNGVPCTAFSYPSIKLTHRQQLTRSLLYALQVLVSMFIMLIFMTYNGYLMISVVVGSGMGFYLFTKRTLSVAQATATKSVACH
ncbi:4416_t:CDS:2 [Ambispora leptoticha]|uniref:Copper transport protein n=1 Tax=Ambispora leptoticha TaxID=144679 RepID=A0A9N8YYC4_9GLOM|nr:4416_t:CDS:2 [Ambispora leptoticha]